MSDELRYCLFGLNKNLCIILSERRQAEVTRITEKYPDRIPVRAIISLSFFFRMKVKVGFSYKILVQSATNSIELFLLLYRYPVPAD